ncbi:MAG: hypothetical protein ACLQVJ_15070 [Syntrophobacteraceae bacterium]
MKLRFFGDSYDIVKQCMLQWLRSFGEWTVHPMFTEPVSGVDAEAFSRFLSARLVSLDILSTGTDRSTYLASARKCMSHLFLDPDTGIRMVKTNGSKGPSYVFGPELVEIATNRPKLLTLVFDQSLARGKEREQLNDKLSTLASDGVHGFAYISHACFILLGCDNKLIGRSLDAIKSASRLPTDRFIF